MMVSLGPGGTGMSWSDDEADGGAFDSDGEGDAFDRLDRKLTIEARARLWEAEESLLQPPEEVPLQVQPVDSQSAGHSANDDNKASGSGVAGGEGAGGGWSDDEEDEVMLRWRAEQAQEKEKQMQKKRNFVKEWASAFVHLRAVGRAIPPPSDAVTSEVPELAACLHPCTGVMSTAGSAPAPPGPSLSDPLPSDGGVEEMDTSALLSVQGSACALLGPTHHSSPTRPEGEEVLASHGSVEEVLACHVSPSSEEDRRAGVAPGGASGKRLQGECLEAQPCHVVTEEVLREVMSMVWADMCTVIKEPLRVLVEKEIHRPLDDARRPSRERRRAAVEAQGTNSPMGP